MGNSTRLLRIKVELAGHFAGVVARKRGRTPFRLAAISVH